MPDVDLMNSAVLDCTATLQRVATYRLPPALDQRLLWLSENKESLTAAEREELFALVEFADERTVEKLQAQNALRRMSQAFPWFERWRAPDVTR